MSSSALGTSRPPVFSRDYWRQAASAFGDTRLLVFAALIIALRVAVKLLKIPLAAGLNLSFDCYVNSLGSLVYGPLMGLAVGAVSDTVGCLLFPSGPYFLPFILTEMSSSFLFGLFFWRRNCTVPRVLLAKFSVNFVCNIVLTSLLMKWDYYVFYGVEKAQGYAAINLVRIVKNLVLFPLEAMLICVILSACLPLLRRMKLTASASLVLKRGHYWLLIGLSLISVGLFLLYCFVGMDFIAAHNFKLW